MSFIKDVIKDFTQSEVILNAETIRSQAWGFLIGGIGLMVFFIGYALVVYLSDDPTIALQVNFRSVGVSETSLVTTDGVFSNGESGVLQYQPKYFIDFIIFHSFGVINIVDIAFVMYIGIILFNALKTVHEKDSFQLIISAAYKQVGRACIWMFFFKMIYDFFLHEYFDYRVADNLYLENSNAFREMIFVYIFFGGIISSFAYFMNKGIALQQDQDLTI